MTLFYIQNRATKEIKDLEDSDFLEYLERIEEEQCLEDIEIRYDRDYNCLDIIPGYDLYSNSSPNESFYTDTMDLIKRSITNLGELANFCYHIDIINALTMKEVFVGLLYCNEYGESFDLLQDGVDHFVGDVKNTRLDIDRWVLEDLENFISTDAINHLYAYIDYDAYLMGEYCCFQYGDWIYIYRD